MNAGMTPRERAEVKRAENESFWSQFDTPLLVAWLHDFKQCKKKLTLEEQADRDLVLKRISSADWAARPRAGEELRELTMLYLNSGGAAMNGVLPGLFKAAPVVPSQVGESSAVGEPAHPGQGSNPQSGAKTSSLAKPQPRKMTAAKISAIATPMRNKARDFMLVPDDEHGDEEEEEFVGLGSPPLHPRVRPHKCKHCTRATVADDCMFVCDYCHMRSDLPADHATNKAFLQLAQARAAGPASSTASSSSSSAAATASSSGQSASDTASLLLSADKLLEKEYEKMLATNPANPLFGSEAPTITPAEVFNLNRKAWKASATERPSPALLKAIRQGKLINVGFAIPVSRGASTDDALITLSGGGLGVRSKSAPKVESLQQFMSALLSTILPALLHDPSGMLQWITLGRTALAISEHTGGFTAAAAYVEQLLGERIFDQKDFCAVSLDILSTVDANSRGGGAGARATRPAGGSGRDRERGGGNSSSAPGGDRATCFDFNKGNCPRGKNCYYQHKCMGCGSQHPQTTCSVRPSGGKAPAVPRSKIPSSVTSAKDKEKKSAAGDGNDSD